MTTPLDLSYSEDGDGLPVVLIHGFPEFRYSWRKQIPTLANAGFRVIAPDLRGYGDSPKPKGAEHYTLPQAVGDVAALIEKIGAPVAVVGHDWGGLVSWLLAMSRPDLVRKLVIMNVPHPAAFSRELHRSTSQKLRASYQLFFRLPILPEIFLRLFLRRLMQRGGRFTDAEMDVYAKAWRGSLTPMLNWYRAVPRSRRDIRKMIARIDLPVLMIWGERDPVFIRETTENYGEWVTDFRIERIARAGHFVQTDAPERVNELLLAFL